MTLTILGIEEGSNEHHSLRELVIVWALIQLIWELMRLSFTRLGDRWFWVWLYWGLELEVWAPIVYPMLYVLFYG